ncbi:hypothetical protein GXW82_43130 [Streptacidiphilus sp. 4-A2]|nr:hypothetical protein [Streptacidiphilus sp. 4-A2]
MFFMLLRLPCLALSSVFTLPVRTVRSADALDAIWAKLTDDAPQPGPGGN